jgi:hypothetical protein
LWPPGAAASAVELPNAVHGVVVVEGEQKLVSGSKRVRLPDELQGVAGVCREHHRVLVRVGAEEFENASAAPLDESCARDGCRIRGMRVAEHMPEEQLRVTPHLGLGVEAAACVVEIDMAEGVEPTEVTPTKVVDGARTFVLRVCGREGGLGLRERRGPS